MLFASKQVLIRKNLYYTIGKSIKAGFPITRIRQDCNMVARIVSDIAKSNDNWILFDNMLLALGSLETDVDSANQVLI